MPAIEVQRQMLPMFGSPNQGARFYNPELPETEPFVPGHRTCAGCGPSNWHTTEVLNHARNNFEGYTFAMRTLEAWGAQIESDRRAYYTAGGRVWVMDLEPSAGRKKRLPGAARK